MSASAGDIAFCNYHRCTCLADIVEGGTLVYVFNYSSISANLNVLNYCSNS